MSNPFSWAVNQLANAERVERQVPRFNPRPPGVIHAGSASESVLQVLRANPKTYYTHGRLMELTGRTHAAVSWALKYLREQGLVKTIGDTSRNERWLKYAAEIGAADVAIAEKPRVKTSAQRVASHETPMPGARVQGLPPVRGSGNQDLPAVAGELRELPEGHGLATEPEALAGQEGHLSALHAGKHDLDRADAADEPAPVLPQGDRARADDDGGRSRATARPADQEHDPAPLGSRVQSGAPEAVQDLPPLDVAHLPGRDAAPSRVGTAPWLTEQCGAGPHQTRHATQPGLFSADAPTAQPIPQTLKAIAA